MAETTRRVIQPPLELKGLQKYMALSSHRSLERAIWTFAELGLADLMAAYGQPITAKELSQLNGNDWHAEYLYRLLRVAADADIVQAINIDENAEDVGARPEETIQYQLTNDGLLLRSNDPSKIRDFVLVDLGLIGDRVANALPNLIKYGMKYGDGFEQTMGSKLFDYMQKEEAKEYATKFNNAMISYTEFTISFMGSNIDFNRFSRIVDIAGGLGTLLSAILEKSPNAHGLLFDLPQVISHAREIHPNEFERRKIPSNRYEFVQGDMFKAETIPAADAYIMKFIIHDWNDEKSIEILKAIRAANEMHKGKQINLFIVEMVILSNNRENWESHAMDLEMLTNLDAKERSLKQYKYLLEQSGFHLKQLYKTGSFMAVIEAETTI